MDAGERGFSFMRDGPLDMRMGVSSGASAEQIMNCWPESELARIFRDFGEERHWRAYAAKIVDAREKGALRTTQELCAALGQVGRRKGQRNKIHPATRVFQVAHALLISLLSRAKGRKLWQDLMVGDRGIGRASKHSTTRLYIVRKEASVKARDFNVNDSWVPISSYFNLHRTSARALYIIEDGHEQLVMSLA